jgi:hypothetical protein
MRSQKLYSATKLEQARKQHFLPGSNSRLRFLEQSMGK